MDNRLDDFIRKFSDAQKYLGGNSVSDLVSIKYRENVNYSSYREFIEVFLHGEMNLEVEEVRGNFLGRGWLIQDSSHNKALLVEHETGLEILYIAGSIASLFSLIPLITSGWRFVRSRFLDHPYPRNREIGIEIRVVNNNNQLLEQHVMRIEDFVLSESMKEITALKERVEQLEDELRKVNEKKAPKSSGKKTVRQAKAGKK